MCWSYTIITLAIAFNRLEIIKTLLENRNINLNEENDLGITALMMAVQEGNIDIIKELLTDARVDVNVQNKDKLTAFDFAVSDDIKKLLMDCR